MHAGRAGRWGDHAGEQLERGGLAGPVGPEKGDELALLDRQIDAAHGLTRAVLAAEQPAERGEQPLLLLIDAIRLGEPGDFDCRHVAIIRGATENSKRPTTAVAWASARVLKPTPQMLAV